MFGSFFATQPQRRALLPRQLLGGLGSNDDSKENSGNGGLLGGLLGGGGSDNKQPETTPASGKAGSNPVPEDPVASGSRVPVSQTPAPVPQSTSSSSSESSSTTSSSTPPPSSSPPASATSSPVVNVSSNIQTVTEFSSSPNSAALAAQSSQSAAQASQGAATGGASSSFLQNKAASGAVFGIAGFVGLVVIVFIIVTFVRKTRTKRLVNEAVSFDPSNMARDLERGSMEKSPYYGSESGHSHDNYGGYRQAQPTYAGYYGSAGYGQTQQYNQYPGAQPYGGAGGNVQLPSTNVSVEQSRGARVAPPPLLPRLNGLPDGVGAHSAGNSPIAPQRPRGVAGQSRRASDNGSIQDNPYGGAHDYKVANE